MDNVPPIDLEARLAHIRRQKANVKQLVELEKEEQRLMALQDGTRAVCLSDHFYESIVDMSGRQISPPREISSSPQSCRRQPRAESLLLWTSPRRRQCSR